VSTIPPEIADFVKTGGWVVGLLLVLWMGHKRIWVWGWAYDLQVQSAESWKTIAKANGESFDKAIELLGKKDSAARESTR
jgi:hypothetical protein